MTGEGELATQESHARRVSAGARTAARPPSMNDVARAAGVSHQTVSRVLNAHPWVRTETRERVEAAISAIGYRRNVAARTLVTQRSGALGIVTSGSALFGPTSTLVAVENAAREVGYLTSVAMVESWVAAGVRQAVEHLVAHGVDGLVVIAGHDEAVAAVRELEAPLPIIVVGPMMDDARVGSVSVDQRAGARAATRHLVALGHGRIAHLAGPHDWSDSRLREQGWRDELDAAGLEHEGLLWRADWSASSGHEVGARLLRSGRATAAFAANDQLALGLLHAATELGVSVPGHFSVVGFDDIEGSAYFHPPLTTVHQDFVSVGRRCVSLLVERLAGAPPGADTVSPELVVRASSGVQAVS